MTRRGDTSPRKAIKREAASTKSLADPWAVDEECNELHLRLLRASMKTLGYPPGRGFHFINFGSRP